MRLHRFVMAVRAAIQRDTLLPEQSVVVVACSGGADSLALLHALRTLCAATKISFPAVTLHVAHLDHGLRGAAGAADAAFVREVASAWGLPYTIGVVAAATRNGWRGSVEAAAREARYHFLRGVATAIGAERIALGHTADDQAETVLMHFLRGSGLDGLAGMRPRAGGLVRPLLSLRRADTVAYCAALGLTPREDATNNDPRYTRNRIRHELLPQLETYQPQIRATLARNAPLIAHDLDYITAGVDEAWSQVVMEASAQSVTLDRAGLRCLHAALRSRVLRRAILAVGSAKPDAHLNADSIQRLDRVIMDHSGEVRRVEVSTGAVGVCMADSVRVMSA